jgi:bifunctional DNA-binding transcriptional regulator/antitoxin component of YhaV-PrlF toxin-antitoxin module
LKQVVDNNAYLHYAEIMITLTVTSRGQVTFKKDVMQHLGLKPGDRIELDLLPGGRGLLKAAHATGSIDAVIGMLSRRGKKTASLDDIKDATAKGWSGSPCG